VVNTVVMWLHILGVRCWCMYVALFGSTFYCRTVQHTYTNKDLLIYAATSPPY